MAQRTAVRVAAAAAADAALECVAVAPGGERVFAGTSGGTLLVYTSAAAAASSAAPATPAAPQQLRLVGRRALSRKPLDALCLLHAARRLAVLVDGTVMLLDTATLEGGPLPAARGATFIAADTRPGQRARLAVAVKRRVLFFDVPPHGGPEPAAAPRLLSEVELPGSPRALVWHWDALLAGTRRGYYALSLRAPGAAATEVCPLAPDAPGGAAPRLAALSPSAEALLLADAVGIVVSMAGAPRGNPLAFGAPPAALAHTPPYVLALAADRRTLEVWDRASAARVQSLALPVAAAAGGEQAAGCLADDGAGGAAALALGRALLLLLPAPLEEQARELLRARQPDAALALADAAATATVPPWLDALRAEIGFLRLQEGAWAAAAESWRACSVFEPGELFPLFPAAAAPFRDAAPLKKYWGMHAPLGDLESVVRGALRARAGGSAAPSAAAVAAAQAEATRALAALLAQLGAQPARVPPAQRAGTDTLLLLLHAQTGAVAAAEALAAAPDRAVLVPHAAALLRDLGRHMAVAALHAAAGDAAAAVETYRMIAAGELREAPASDGAVAAAAAALAASSERPPTGGASEVAAADAAAALLARSADAAPLLAALPWLLDAWPPAALRAVTAPRPAGAPPLQAAPVLALLRPRGGEALLAFLEHAAAAPPGPAEADAPERAALHTELGAALFAAVARARAEELAAASSRDDERSPPRVRLRAFLARPRPAYDVSALLAAADAADAAGAPSRWPPLLRERVLLHAASGAHAAALTLLVRALRDCDAAEAYAAGRDTPAARADALLALLRIYLEEGLPGDASGADAEPAARRWARAAALLSARGGALDGERALAMLPDSAPLAAALPLLAGLLASGAHARRSGAIGAALARRRHQVAAEALADARASGVRLDENTSCGACHARLWPAGEVRPFARYPTGLLACHKCSAGLAAASGVGGTGGAPAEH